MAEQKKLKIGIIGCGGIANGKHFPALKANSDLCEMVAFCDILEERAKEAAEKYGVEGACVYTDYKELIANPDIDVVHICTPNRHHSYMTVDALEAGKHVMCEKPMAINTKEAELMVEAAKRTGKKLSIGYQNRNLPQNIYLKREAEAGTFGDIYYARATALRRRAVPTWGVFLNEEEQGGGPLIDIGTHALDLTLWIMNNYKPKYVVGTAFHALNDQTETGNAWGDWDPSKFTVEDSAFGFVVMENGATIMLESSWAINMIDAIECRTLVCGNKAGGDNHDGARINGVKFGRQYQTKIATDASGVAFYNGKGDDPSEQEAKKWLTAINNNTDPVVLPEQALVITKILEGIYISSKTGKPYYFDQEN